MTWSPARSPAGGRPPSPRASTATGEPQHESYCQADGAPRLLFIRVPEPKRGKNRIHLDLLADDRDAEEARLVELGATVVARQDEADESWIVMSDPYGNEFCLS